MVRFVSFVYLYNRERIDGFKRIELRLGANALKCLVKRWGRSLREGIGGDEVGRCYCLVRVARCSGW